MKHFVNILASFTLLSFGFTGAYALGQNDNQNSNSANNQSQTANQMLTKIRTDLDQAVSEAQKFSPQQNELARASERISDLQGKWEAGMRDPQDIDQAIASVQHALKSKALPEGSRNMLSGDVAFMRNFRTDYLRGR